jgi:hypothetical protein
MSTNNSSTNTEIPRDAKLIQNILTSMGVEEYEPRVVNQLLEFMYSMYLVFSLLDLFSNYH